MKKAQVVFESIYFIVAIFFIVILVTSHNASAASTPDGIEYTITDSAAIITGYSGPGGEIVIPGSITDGGITYDVTGIGDYAFYKNSYGYQITSVLIPETITSIGTGAFKACKLTKVTIPKSITRIEPETFSSCIYLVSVTIPTTVNSIGNEAFAGCYSLASITIPNGVVSIGNTAFYMSGLTSVNIPNSVKNIGERAFGSCWNLTTINVGGKNTAYTSKDGVLYNKAKTILLCYPTGKINSLFNIPDTVISISTEAFTSNTNLVNVIIPNSVKEISPKAFFRCSALTDVMIPDGVTSIGWEAFQECNLTSVVIPDSITRIEFNTFAWCKNLTTITIGKNVNYIGVAPFNEDNSVKTVNYYPVVAPTLDRNALAGILPENAIFNIPSGATGYDVLPWTLYQQNAVVRVTEIMVAAHDSAVTVPLRGSIQMEAVVFPESAADRTVTWNVINGTGRATIDAGGLLTGTKVGTVTVTANANDGSGIRGSKEITVIK